MLEARVLCPCEQACEVEVALRVEILVTAQVVEYQGLFVAGLFIFLAESGRFKHVV